MTAGGEIQHDRRCQCGEADPTVNAGLALGRLIHEALTEIHERLDRIERQVSKPRVVTPPGEYPEYVIAAWTEWQRLSPRLAPWHMLTPEQQARYAATIGVAVELAP